MCLNPLKSRAMVGRLFSGCNIGKIAIDLRPAETVSDDVIFVDQEAEVVWLQ